MKRSLALALCGVTLGLALPVMAQNTPSPPGAEVYIIWPADGTVIHGGKLWVRMGLRGMGVAPAGTAVPNTGHHHLLINADPPPPGEPIPSDRNHLHFGGGETEARLSDLPPGEYTLQLELADGKHYPFNPPLISDKVHITVAPY